MSIYSEFQYWLAEHVSSDGLPDRIEEWKSEDLRKLIEFAETELKRRTS
jgi:hypothetical protein